MPLAELLDLPIKQASNKTLQKRTKAITKQEFSCTHTEIMQVPEVTILQR